MIALPTTLRLPTSLRFPTSIRALSASDGSGLSKTRLGRKHPALALGALIAALSGCAAFPLQERSAARHRPVAIEPEAHPAVNPQTQREKAMLAAVEDFLRSTDDFQLPDQKAAAPVDLGSSEQPVGQSNVGAGQRKWVREGILAPAGHEGTLAQAGQEGRSSEEQAAVANSRVALSVDPPPRAGQTLPILRSVSISPIARQQAVPEPNDAGEGTTNQALQVQEPAEEMTEARFVNYLESRTNPEDAFDFDAEWRLRLVHAALDHMTEAMKVSPKMSSDSEGLLDSLVSVIDATRHVASDPLAVGEDALEQVDELRRVLAERADPIVQTIELCLKVTTFGVFERMDEEEFLAGRNIRTIIYTEIANLSAEETPDGKYKTSLATRAEVLTAAGESVWQHEEPEIVDLCSGRRRDFFIAQRITLPGTLPAGDYVLKLLIEDKLSGKANESSRRFTIQSPMSVASSG